jgi:hypothetical protein
MNFEGCTSNWKDRAEQYMRSAYEADWSPASLVRKENTAAKLNDVTNKCSSTSQQKRPTKRPPSKTPALVTKKAKRPTSGFSAFSAFVASHGDVLIDEPDDVDDRVMAYVSTSSEVDKYLQLPALPTCRHGQDTCPLEWWGVHQVQLPHLAKMARQFLALPASSAGVERLFSAAGRQHDDLKKAIKEDTLSMQLEVKVNIPE